jgi:hypothetical protein
MIYGRTGNPVTIQRLATIEDVKALDNRKPDKHDRDRIALGCYVVASDNGTGKLRLYDTVYMRATEGYKEIGAVIDACKANGGQSVRSAGLG